MTTGRPSPLELLTDGVASLTGQLQEDGTLHDPVFNTPTQYGGAYYAWCCAVLAAELGGSAAEEHRTRAERSLAAAVAHTADPDREPYASGFDRPTLSVTGRLNHRDFTWPPILKTYLALGRLGVGLSPAVSEAVAGVRVEASFRTRPPSNWAAVWMSGEWLRMQAGLSDTTPEQFDRWIDVFFAEGEVGFDLGLGMYRERGLPNAYDLFTRAHFTDLLQQGYAGRNRERLEAFLAAGLRRSLSLQLSDGSMASGYRSAGQTWVLGAQVALFTGSRVAGPGPGRGSGGGRARRLAGVRVADDVAAAGRGLFSGAESAWPPSCGWATSATPLTGTTRRWRWPSWRLPSRLGSATSRRRRSRSWTGGRRRRWPKGPRPTGAPRTGAGSRWRCWRRRTTPMTRRGWWISRSGPAGACTSSRPRGTSTADRGWCPDSPCATGRDRRR